MFIPNPVHESRRTRNKDQALLKSLRVFLLLASVSLAALAGAASIAWGQQGTTFTPGASASLQTSRDVAVTSIGQDGPPFAEDGDSVTIRVGVRNNGDREETFEVSLTDVSDDLHIGSESVTVESGGSTTVTFEWDTTGATGGPPPPGPPAPGSIHQLTATAILEGDSSPDNNSMSLFPGIWVIAAPSPSGISFPEIEKEPQAIFGKEQQLSLPEVDTAAITLSKTFFGPTDVSQVVSASKPAVVTRLVDLPGIFSTMALGSLSGALARPQVVTIIETAAQIAYDGLHASLVEKLLRPVLGNEVKRGISLKHSGPARAESLSPAGVLTIAEQLGSIFTSSPVFKLKNSLIDPILQTPSGPRELIETSPLQASGALSLSSPGISTFAASTNSLRSFSATADAVGGLKRSEVGTIALPPNEVFPGGIQSDLNLPADRPEVGSQRQLLRSTFISKGAVVQNTERPLANPFESIVIRGTIKLQERKSSLGSYVEVGDEVFFADSDGSYEFMVREGTGQIALRAPGYVPIIVNNGQLEKGGTISLPTFTLLFGDANEDGVIDIYDITIAAGNFGETTRRLTTP